MHYEMWGPSTKPWGFGHAYEILRLVNGKRFEYLDDTLYLPFGVELDEHGHYLRTKLGEEFFKYNAHGNYSVLHFHNPSTLHQRMDILTPPGIAIPEADEFTRNLTQRINKREYSYSYPLESAFYCMIYQFKSPDFVTPPYFSVIPKEEVGFPGWGVKIDIGDDQFFKIEVKHGWAEWSYKVIREAEGKRKGGIS